MASYFIFRPLCTSHLLYPSPISQDTVSSCTGTHRKRLSIEQQRAIALRWRPSGGPSLCLSFFSVQLPASSSSRSIGVVAPLASFTKQINRILEAGVGSKLPPYKEETWADVMNGGVFMDPIADPGLEFDYRIYASNTMEGFEPPPEPPIPFGGPFEDYYDKYVGVDYVPKQEKPTSSFLMFLESMNKKRAEEEAKLREKDPSRPPFNPTPNKHLFEGKKPLFTLSRPIEPAPPPRQYMPPTPGEETKRLPLAWPDDEPPFVPRARRVTDSPDKPLIQPAHVSPSDTQIEPAESVTVQDGMVQEFSATNESDQNVRDTVPPSPCASMTLNNAAASKDMDQQARTSDPAPPPLFHMMNPDETEANGAPYMPTKSENMVGGTIAPPSPSTSADSVEASSGTSRSLFPHTRPVEEHEQAQPKQPETSPTNTMKHNDEPSGSAPSDSRAAPFELESRQLRERQDSRSLAPQMRGVEEISSFVPSAMPVEANNSLEEKLVEDGFVNGSRQPFSPLDDSSIVVGIEQHQPVGLGQCADSVYLQDGYGGEVPKSPFYIPKAGDLVLAVVLHAGDFVLTLEIGAELPAFMNIRDFQPLDTIGDVSFHNLPAADGGSESINNEFVAPATGRVLIVEDKAANDGIYRSGLVGVGSIIVAEVLGILQDRVYLSCRRPAQALGFWRIEQVKRTGEPLKVLIKSYNNGGLQGNVEGVRAFLPRSELLQRFKDPAMLQSYVGRTLMVSVVQAEEQAANLIISEQKPWMSENLLLGSVHDLTVNRIYPYGLQVDIDNTCIRGFIHISNITRSYVPSLNTFFTEGDRVRAMLIRGRRPDQPSFSIEAIEPMDAPGLVLRDREQVFQEAEEVARTTEEYQLPMEERRIFGLPSGAIDISSPSAIANLPWLQLHKSKLK